MIFYLEMKTRYVCKENSIKAKYIGEHNHFFTQDTSILSLHSAQACPARLEGGGVQKKEGASGENSNICTIENIKYILMHLNYKCFKNNFVTV